MVDEVPILFRDLDAWLGSEAIECVRRADLPPATERLVARGALARNDRLVEVYERSREGPLQDWLRALTLPGEVLELGAGIGVTGRSDVVALDNNLATIRRHPGTRVCADAADPPFLPERFDAVVLANVLDSCAQPALVLAQADALLRPGGTLVVTCAYAFDDAVTPPRERFRPDELEAALDGAASFHGYGLRQRIVERHDRIAWPLRLGPRTTHVHEVQVFVSTKLGAPRPVQAD